jgi:hypothetical protein
MPRNAIRLKNTNYIMISTSSASRNHGLGLKPVQIDAAQYKPFT